MTECELLEDCGFFKKYMYSLEMECRGYLMTYCHGSLMSECKRKEFREVNGFLPDDDMLPSGQMMPDRLKPKHD